MTDPKKVLIVDDEPDLREALETIFTSAGFTVMTAEEGHAALKLAFQEHPDLLLLDIHMPGMDGISMLRELRADDWGKDAMVFMLTAQSDIDNISQAVEFGGSKLEYLVKTDWELQDILNKAKAKLGVTD